MFSRATPRRAVLAMALAAAAVFWPAAASAQEENPENARGKLSLSASFGKDIKTSPTGLVWRIFQERARPDGGHDLVTESHENNPLIDLPHGNYIVHASWGLAGAARRVALFGEQSSQQIEIRAGSFSVTALIGDRPAPAHRISISVYVPEHNNPEAKLVARGLRGEEILRLPEGSYHIVSTYLDGGRPGAGETEAGQPTNSVVAADVRIESGKITVATLRHRAALLTLKLVNAPGSEALANTSFTILTPGGDVIRELIGAFPSLILAEGEYVAIARNDGRTFQSTFRVESGRDRDVEILVKK